MSKIVVPSYRRYEELLKGKADLVLDGTLPVEEIVRLILGILDKGGVQKC